MKNYFDVVTRLLDPPFKPVETRGNIAERGYTTDAEHAESERVQASRAAQTRWNNDFRETD